MAPASQTPEPISAVIELAVSDVHISAADRPDTVVEVRPSDSARPADVKAAEQTRVEYSAGRLLVEGTGRWRSWSPLGYGGSVDVNVELPVGSQVTGASSLGTFRCTGALGDCRIKTAGEIHLEQARAVKLTTANGDIRVGAAGRGSVVAETGIGAVEIAIPDGTAAWLDLHTGYGQLHNTLDAAEPPQPGADTVEVCARTGYGDITIRRCYPPAGIKRPE
jgi:hypothetical protein